MLELWYRALASELGISVVCSDAAAVRAQLYKVRTKVQDLDLSGISIHLSPFDQDRLWLIKNSARENAAQGRQGDN